MGLLAAQVHAAHGPFCARALAHSYFAVLHFTLCKHCFYQSPSPHATVGERKYVQSRLCVLYIAKSCKIGCMITVLQHVGSSRNLAFVLNVQY